MKYSMGRRFVQELDPTGKILLMGMSYEGIPQDGFYLREGQDPYEALGECELADQYIIALRSGLTAADILIYRLNGIKGSMQLTNALDGQKVLEISSIGASEETQNISILVSPYGLVVYKDGEDVTQRTYTFEDYETVEDLVRRINRDADFGLLEVEARLLTQRYLKDCVFQEASYPFYMASGEDELVRTDETDIEAYTIQYLERVKEATLRDDGEFGEAFSVPTEAISIVGIYHDESPAITKRLGEFCALKTEETKIMTIAVLGTNPIPGKTEEMDYGIDENGNAFDDEGNLYIYDPWKERNDFLEKLNSEAVHAIGEEGIYVHVVIGHHQTVRGLASIAPAYTANYVQNEIGKSFTNKEIKGIGEFLFNLQKKELVGLESNGYICTVPSIRRNVVSQKSQNFYTYERTTYKAKPHLIRLTLMIAREVEQELEQYIGESSTMNVTDSETLLRAQFEVYMKSNLIKRYELKVTRPELARMRVDILLVPYGSVEEIALEQDIQYEEKEVFRWMDV